MSDGLDDSRSGRGWSVENPGLHRFISSDPRDPERLPTDIIEAVLGIKRRLLDSLRVPAGDRVVAEWSLAKAARLGRRLAGARP